MRFYDHLIANAIYFQRIKRRQRDTHLGYIVMMHMRSFQFIKTVLLSKDLLCSKIQRVGLKPSAMKSVYIFLLLLGPTVSFGQIVMADSLKQLLRQKHSDTSRIMLQVELAHTYLFYQQDSA